MSLEFCWWQSVDPSLFCRATWTSDGRRWVSAARAAPTHRRGVCFGLWRLSQRAHLLREHWSAGKRGTAPLPSPFDGDSGLSVGRHPLQEQKAPLPFYGLSWNKTLLGGCRQDSLLWVDCFWSRTVLFGWSRGVWRVLSFSVVVFWCFTFIYLGGEGWGGGGQCSGTVFIFINSVEKYLQIFLYWNVSWDWTWFMCVCVRAQLVLIICLSLSKHCCPACTAFISYDCTANSLILPLSAYIEPDLAINYMCMQSDFYPPAPKKKIQTKKANSLTNLDFVHARSTQST